MGWVSGRTGVTPAALAYIFIATTFSWSFLGVNLNHSARLVVALFVRSSWSLCAVSVTFLVVISWYLCGCRVAFLVGFSWCFCGFGVTPGARRLVELK